MSPLWRLLTYIPPNHFSPKQAKNFDHHSVPIRKNLPAFLGFIKNVIAKMDETLEGSAEPENPPTLQQM
ncbi:hypothetical protein B5B97_03400 [Staphylococcus delphini]|nr:hypothetical protein B5B99_02150 [Staphylococcus delphini]PCF53352.1 hypothetical protein B5C03_02725 [Staphylococcus delphini]PCF58551.1 hypothetical protein B5B97_03400 [Staphylococcus delphini]PCF60986.1 hypothetical protein B5C05_02025 [Staphylococcus delphini]